MKPNQPPMATGLDYPYTKPLKLCLDKKRCPISFFWWAETPTGRQSKFSHQVTIDRARPTGLLRRGEHGETHEIYVPTSNYNLSDEAICAAVIERQDAFLSSTRAGHDHKWHGPVMVENIRAPEAETEWFKFAVPTSSEGVSMSQIITTPMHEIARKLLKEELS